MVLYKRIVKAVIYQGYLLRLRNALKAGIEIFLQARAIERGLFVPTSSNYRRSQNMNEEGKVCIKCRTAGELKMVLVRDGEQVVGLIYACANCFHVIQNYKLDIYFSEKSRTDHQIHTGMASN
jgi:hypothetical protein